MKQNIYRIDIVRTKIADVAAELRSPSQTARYCQWMTKYDREYLVRLDLDARCHLIGRETVHVGTVDAVTVSPREIFRGALLGGGRQIIVVHNHPSGCPSPSDEDLAIADRLEEIGKLMDLPVVDFMIVGDGGAFWCRSSGPGQVDDQHP